MSIWDNDRGLQIIRVLMSAAMIEASQARVTIKVMLPLDHLTSNPLSTFQEMLIIHSKISQLHLELELIQSRLFIRGINLRLSLQFRVESIVTSQFLSLKWRRTTNSQNNSMIITMRTNYLSLRILWRKRRRDQELTNWTFRNKSTH